MTINSTIPISQFPWLPQRVLLVLLISLLCCSTFYAQNLNRPVPTSFPQYEFKIYDTVGLGGYYVFAPHRRDGASGWTKGLSIIDEDGYIVWWTATFRKGFDFKFNPELNQYSFSEIRNGKQHHMFLNTNFELVDSIVAPNPYGGDIHEMLALANGNKMIIGIEHVTMDLSSYTFDGVQGSSNTIVADPVILEFDTGNNVIWEWKARDHLPINMFVDSYNYDPNGFDYLHPNSIEESPGNTLIVSLRNANSLIQIDRTTGNVNWIFGGNNNQFSLANDTGFEGQHDARVRPDGTISIYDNQISGTSDSRGVVYNLDTATMSASKISEFHHPGSSFGRIMGSYRKTLNNAEVISWGSSNRPAPTVTLLDEFGNLISDFFFEDTILTYRAFFQELPALPAQPEIICSHNGVNLELTAPTSNFYLWSTGESTQTITIADTGTFVVWIDQGIGMLGSKPFHVADINQACPTTSLLETTSVKLNQKIEGYFSIHGQRLSKRPVNTIYFIRYESGEVKRAVSIE
jgi:hypothetical protein